MTQKGEHTWDLIIHYHRCPHCGYINENRQSYVYRLGKYLKEVDCQRCEESFTVKKTVPPPIGPLFGEPQPIETEWGC